MPLTAAARNAEGDRSAARYQRHRPEQTLLYQLVEQHYPVFIDCMAGQGWPLPGYVQREFEDYLKCGRLEHGFLRVRCDRCHAEHLVAFSCKRRGFCPSCGARRMAESAALLVAFSPLRGRDSGVVIDIPKTIGDLQAYRHILFGVINGAECP
jgi:ribosomal protein S27E